MLSVLDLNRVSRNEMSGTGMSGTGMGDLVTDLIIGAASTEVRQLISASANLVTQYGMANRAIGEVVKQYDRMIALRTRWQKLAGPQAGAAFGLAFSVGGAISVAIAQIPPPALIQAQKDFEKAVRSILRSFYFAVHFDKTAAKIDAALEKLKLVTNRNSQVTYWSGLFQREMHAVFFPKFKSYVEKWGPEEEQVVKTELGRYSGLGEVLTILGLIKLIIMIVGAIVFILALRDVFRGNVDLAMRQVESREKRSKDLLDWELRFREGRAQVRATLPTEAIRSSFDMETEAIVNARRLEEKKKQEEEDERGFKGAPPPLGLDLGKILVPVGIALAAVIVLPTILKK